ncbi:hypothetical protein [Amorphus orientalis]|uniref:SH3 domain-containing protein n=1 Tax=Amorphus orientalis TaxID=649198 RepID=A0AAE3VP77_9HYPH|nr:hypothetical protein [Amorphus orientalis]MDQ0315498.1 hypothetical protein [Amorphus orientalis]
MQQRTAFRCCRRAIGVAAILCLTSPAALGDTETADVVPCTISAWSKDDRPHGLTVHEGPGIGTPVLATLPPSKRFDGSPIGTEVSIAGSRNGWFLIREAVVVDYYRSDPSTVVFEGRGWVNGDKLALLLNHRTLYAKPSANAEEVADLYSASARSGPDGFVVDRLHACTGSWVDVEGQFFGAKLRGWSVGTCSNQVTTCP